MSSLSCLMLLLLLSLGSCIKLSQTRGRQSVSQQYLQSGCYDQFMDYLSQPISNKDEALTLNDLYDLSLRLCTYTLSTVKNQYKPY
mmetsp:Transcript_15560/g.11333  ORF Transcript_15560/g.11333 Transcript_15560/m.11333 type:complete len:86 (-) Transcript_15560:93-350(-)